MQKTNFVNFAWAEALAFTIYQTCVLPSQVAFNEAEGCD